MTTTIPAPRLAPLLAAALALSGCLSLRPPAPPVDLFALEPAPGPPGVPGPGPALLVADPLAAPGADGAGLVYLRRPYERRAYARSAWVDTPARMMAPMLVTALERTGRFAAVTGFAGAATPGLRLDSQVLRLQHEVQEPPGLVRVTLRVVLTDLAARRVLGTREVEAVEPAPSGDAAGAVVAANAAVRRALDEVAAWCAGLAGGG